MHYVDELPEIKTQPAQEVLEISCVPSIIVLKWLFPYLQIYLFIYFIISIPSNLFIVPIIIIKHPNIYKTDF